MYARGTQNDGALPKRQQMPLPPQSDVRPLHAWTSKNWPLAQIVGGVDGRFAEQLAAQRDVLCTYCVEQLGEAMYACAQQLGVAPPQFSSARQTVFVCSDEGHVPVGAMHS
jgi:hypothetical protein